MATHTRWYFERQLKICLKHRNAPGNTVARGGARYYIGRLRELATIEQSVSRPTLGFIQPKEVAA